MSISPLAPAPAAGNAQQVTQLNQLVSKYKGDISRNVSPQVLASLARQITVDERTAGEHVMLPRAQAAAVQTAPAPVPVPGKVNVTA
jgi:hypothetical protein